MRWANDYFPACRLGTQPKGIGDVEVMETGGEVDMVCRLGTQPKGIGDYCQRGGNVGVTSGAA